MLITIHNLPLGTGYNDVKSLIQSKCGTRDVILDNLMAEGAGMKVTVGIADEGDAAMIVRKLNGLYIQNLQLYVQLVRQKHSKDKPYYMGSANTGNNSTLDIKNNQYQPVPPPGSIPQMYQSPPVHQMLMPQMGTNQMVPPKIVPPPNNFSTTGTNSFNYDTSLNSQLGFSMQQQYGNTNMLPALISYPIKQNLDFGFGVGNQYNSNQGNQPWESYNANNAFNPCGQNNFTGYSGSSESRFGPSVPAPQTQMDNRVKYTEDRTQGLKRKRSKSPANRQSNSRQAGSDWRNKGQSNSARRDSSNNYQTRSMYGWHAASSSRRDEASATTQKSRWNGSPQRSSNSNRRDYSKSDFSTRSSNFDRATKSKSDFSTRNSNYENPKRFKTDFSTRSNFEGANNSKSDFSSRKSNYEKDRFKSDLSTRSSNSDSTKKFKWNSNNKPNSSQSRAINKTPAQQSAAKNYNAEDSSSIVPTAEILKSDNTVRNTFVMKLIKDILTNPKLIKTKENIPNKFIRRQLFLAINARVFLLTNSMYNLKFSYYSKMYRKTFSESDDQHLYNVIVNRCKQQMPMFMGKVQKKNPQKKKSSNAEISTQPSKPLSVEANKPQGSNQDKQVYKDQKKESKLQFQLGPSVIQGDPLIKTAVEKEMKDIDEVLLQLIQEKLQNATSTEKRFFQLFEEKGVTSKVNEVLQVNVLRRMLNTNVKPMLRIFGCPNIPNKTALMDFLQGFDILKLKKSDRGKFYIATCGNYTSFDTLCTMANVLIDSKTVSFKPLHLGGPPIKKARKDNDIAPALAQIYKDLENTQTIESAEPAAETISSANEIVDNEILPNESDDRGCKQADNANIKIDAKPEDIKCEKQEEQTHKLEIKNESAEANKETNVAVKENEVLNSEMKNELDWPTVANGVIWEEEVEVKGELLASGTDKSDSIKVVEKNMKDNEDSNETFIIQAEDNDKLIVKDEKNGDNTNVLIMKNENNSDNTNEQLVMKNEENDDNTENVGDDRVDDADDIDIDDVDDDDLEDY